MPIATRLMKKKWYARPHQMQLAWEFDLETADKQDTIVPVAMYDEGLGDPASYNAHPQHASFAEAAEPNCYPESTISDIFIELKVGFTKGAIETDKIQGLSYCFMPIHMAFENDYTANDDSTSLEIQDILNMQFETTDRQGYPLFSGTKLTERIAGWGTFAANVPGLTTNQIMESVTLGTGAYYDMLHYRSNARKLQSVQSGIKWNSIYRVRPTRSHKFRLTSDTKFMNQYTFYGIYVMAPPVSDIQQYVVAADTTAISHLWCSLRSRFNEWHQAFNMERT